MVAPLVGAALVSGVSSLLGGLFGRSSKKKAAAQTDFLNRNKIRMTVHDAKQAGVAPLAALGSPVSGAWGMPSAANPMGDAIASGGAQIAQSMQGKPQAKLTNLQGQLVQAQIRKTNAETVDLLSSATSRSTISRIRAGNTSGPVNVAPTSADPTPIVQHYSMPDGTIVPLTVGPDADEIGMGLAVYGAGSLKSRRAQALFNINQRNRYVQKPPSRPSAAARRRLRSQRAKERAWAYRNQAP